MRLFSKNKKNLEINNVQKHGTFRLSDMKPKESAVVEAVCGTGAIRRRIIDMGITPGVKIEVVKLAPLGDPLEIKLRGYQLSIRKSEACEIYLSNRNRDVR